MSMSGPGQNDAETQVEEILEQLCRAGKSFHERGYAHGSTGNLSVRFGDEVFVTPTGGSLGALTPDALARIDLAGVRRGGGAPSKETPFHLAVYRARPEARAIVHLHAPHSVAVSCLEDLDPAQPLPAITPYYFMRVAPLGVLPYFRPGSPDLAGAIEEAARGHHCLLLCNHGSVCAGRTLEEAIDRAEELEAVARLALLLEGRRLRTLTPIQIDELTRTFGR